MQSCSRMWSRGVIVPVFPGFLLFIMASAAPGPAMAQQEDAAGLAGSPFGAGDRSSGLGLSGEYNPAIGANVRLTGRFVSRDLESDPPVLPGTLGESIGRSGIYFDEAEISIAAAVDPYFRADLTVAMHREGDDYLPEIEEALLTTLFIEHVTFRAGKFLMPFGRHNILHGHAFPFVDRPLPSELYLGEDGLNEVGLEASVLLPLPWFVEVTADVVNGDSRVLFASPTPSDLAFGGRLRTLVELGDETTVEIGGSYFGGRNVAKGWTHVYGADMTLRYLPAGRELYNQVVWQSEYMQVLRTGDRPAAPAPGADVPYADTLGSQADVPSGSGGLYSYVAGQLSRWLWLQARYDAVGFPAGECPSRRLQRASGLLALVPSEFSAFRLQYGYLFEEDVHTAFLQVVFGIGAHPAHPY